MFLRISSKCSAKSFTGLDDAKQHKGLEGDHIRHIGATMLILLVGAPPALPDEVPTRKAGLWEIKTDWGNGGPSLVIRQCADATTDYMMQSPAGAFDEAACSKRIVQRSSDTLMIDTACKIGGGRTSVTSHAVVTGSLDRAYTMTGDSGVGIPCHASTRRPGS